MTAVLVAFAFFLLVLTAVLVRRHLDRKDPPMSEMKRSYLVQRLNKPSRGSGPLAAFAEAFSFGGGLRNGGLSEDAMTLLRQVFSFDYMGAAEFEWGAVPEALRMVAKAQRNLRASTITIPLAQVAAGWRDKTTPGPDVVARVYLLCQAGHETEVETRVRLWAAEGYRARLKESTQLDEALRPSDDREVSTVGWLELDNGFFFFTDRDMWAATCSLFGVDVDQAVA